jgi:hypothetical protein
MSSRTVTGAKQRAELAAAVRNDFPPDEVEARRAALAEQTLAERIRTTVAKAPALSAEQRLRLAALLISDAA